MKLSGQIGVQPTLPLERHSVADWMGFVSAIASPGIAEGKYIFLLSWIEPRFLGQAHSLVIVPYEAFLHGENINYDDIFSDFHKFSIK